VIKLRLTDAAKGSYDAAPQAVQKAFDQQIRLLTKHLRHASLRAKKYDEAPDIWQARVNRNWRFYCQIAGDTYVILKLIPHPQK